MKTFLASLLLIFISSPAEALCSSDESCVAVSVGLLSVVMVPIYIMLALVFRISPATRILLRIFAGLPALAAIWTGYALIDAQRFDLLFIPLIYLGIMALMIRLGRKDCNETLAKDST